MINAKSDQAKKEAAWTFIKFLTDAPQQEFRARNGGNLPTLKALYKDQDLISNVEVVALAKESIQQARSRPVSPMYMEIAPKISSAFNMVLKGETEPGYAVSVLQMELQGIVDESITAVENR